MALTLPRPETAVAPETPWLPVWPASTRALEGVLGQVESGRKAGDLNRAVRGGGRDVGGPRGPDGTHAQGRGHGTGDPAVDSCQQRPFGRAGCEDEQVAWAGGAEEGARQLRGQCGADPARLASGSGAAVAGRGCGFLGVLADLECQHGEVLRQADAECCGSRGCWASGEQVFGELDREVGPGQERGLRLVLEGLQGHRHGQTRALLHTFREGAEFRGAAVEAFLERTEQDGGHGLVGCQHLVEADPLACTLATRLPLLGRPPQQHLVAVPRGPQPPQLDQPRQRDPGTGRLRPPRRGPPRPGHTQLAQHRRTPGGLGPGALAVARTAGHCRPTPDRGHHDPARRQLTGQPLHRAGAGHHRDTRGPSTRRADAQVA
ncbi:hypothetical protein SAMN05414137_114221 [Streptacidiphilus jiangxiensis]|uniref:Uncharacterized protein n=1 Tax=Streptacidiphilus jiangxiensis TaxID=235985 RepID=A0A1H7TVT4_STRJI|nr:hypothetical protein SAMN05414137_114221 [Streptacidiphilus jiangxiensis]